MPRGSLEKERYDVSHHKRVAGDINSSGLNHEAITIETSFVGTSEAVKRICKLGLENGMTLTVNVHSWKSQERTIKIKIKRTL